MKYTEEVKQALSRRVAEKFGIEPFKPEYESCRNCFEPTPNIWLHDDWHTLGDECAKRKMSVDYYDTHVHIVSFDGKLLSKVAYADCNDDQSLVERIARLLALVEV